MSNCLCPKLCPKGGNVETDKLEFLLITDQRDSSKSPHNDVKPKTARHFNEFIPSLCQSARVIKNIGDSLMVHVQLEKAELPEFLDKILTAQEALRKSRAGAGSNSNHQSPVPIRIVMVHLDPNERLIGEQIGWDSKATIEAEIPPPRFPDCGDNWLCGDLFGSNVALAFRGASVPKADIVVIDRRLLKEWDQEKAKDEYFESDDSKLHFGPILAFSPFKGLEDIYKFGGGGPVEESSWEGHLFLRMVGRKKEDVDHARKNPLVLDQQRVRVFTDIIWIGKAPETEMIKLRDALEKTQKFEEFPSANYVRQYAKVKIIKDFPEGTISHDADVVLIGAYPNPDAYYVIRKELSELWAGKEVRYAYPVTNEVFPDESEMKTAFWNPGDLSSPFILILARWSEPDRLNPASTAESRIVRAIKKTTKADGLQMIVIRCGLIQGGLWDVYATIKISGSGHAKGLITEDEVSSLCSKLQQECFASATVRLCETIQLVTESGE